MRPHTGDKPGGLPELREVGRREDFPATQWFDAILESLGMGSPCDGEHPKQTCGSAHPRMICRRVVIISAAVGWRSREVYTVCPLVCAFTTKAFALLGSTTILAARRCRRQLAPRSWL
jgi:hypothetical protein